jgi:hypothetical protein
MPQDVCVKTTPPATGPTAVPAKRINEIKKNGAYCLTLREAAHKAAEHCMVANLPAEIRQVPMLQSPVSLKECLSAKPRRQTS